MTAPTDIYANPKSTRAVVVVAGTIVVAAAILLVSSLSSPWTGAGDVARPRIYEIGLLVWIILGTIFTALYAWRTTAENRRTRAALFAADHMLAQERQLSAVGSLAAAASHELGTPLATIAVAAKEMTRELPTGPLADDAALIAQQTERCRAILKQLTLHSDTSDLSSERISLEDLLKQAADSYLHRGKDLIIQHHHADGTRPIKISPHPELLYAIKNFTENAVDFAHARVELTAAVDGDQIIVTIDDDGPGFDPVLLPRLGQPNVTSRTESSRAGGLGLGVFIASTLIGRTGGQVTFDSSDMGGARVRCVWPMRALTV